MNRIVVCRKVRLGSDGGKFSRKLIAAVELSACKITDDYMEEQNRNWKISGRYYELDEKATKEREERIAKENDPISKMTRDELKEKADEMGIEYPKNIKTEKLIELIKE